MFSKRGGGGHKEKEKRGRSKCSVRLALPGQDRATNRQIKNNIAMIFKKNNICILC